MIRKVLILSFLSFILGIDLTYANVNHHEINKGWRFRDTRSECWHPAIVPGCVHLDLMNNHLIDDPFFRLNDRSVQWIDKEDWVYETHFNASSEEANAERQELVFKGLDTYGEIYLNHNRILLTDNMHREWRKDVKGILKEGDNLLEVYFHSAIRRNLPKYDALPYRHNAGPDHSQLGGVFDKALSPFARTAGFEYGWDWGSRFVTSGIWRPIYLETWNKAKLTDVWYNQKDVTAKRAIIDAQVEIDATTPIANAQVTITANGKKLASRKTSLKAGHNTLTLRLQMKNPRLWWCNGMGEPYLYDFKTTVRINGNSIGERKDAIGVRSIKWVNKKDNYGKCLYLTLNGYPVFCKGANMVPNDNFLTRCTDSVYHEVVRSARDVNMNMIRVWGGGIYEDDAFYKYCDQMGIMLWHDFMFACQTYEVDSAFLSTVREEAIYNVKRLRNHACMALYAGNNEAQDIFWGWGNRKADFAKVGQDKRVWQMQRSIFYETLPQVVKEYGGDIEYRPSSPYSAPDTCSDGRDGDDHYWGVWHGAEPFEAFYDHHVRFESEYGFQSFPEYESVLRFAPDSADHDIYGEVMMEHQNAGTYANRRIEEYMNRYYKVPKTFKDFLYVGQLLQGDGVKIGMEAFRTDKPYCRGSLVWQLNDCWPVASWSSRDYYGRWKCLHYFFKNAYDDILVSPRVMTGKQYKEAYNYLKDRESNKPIQTAALPTEVGAHLKAAQQMKNSDKVLRIKIVSDRLKPVKGTYCLKTITLDGKVVYEDSKDIKLAANDCKEVAHYQVSDILGGCNPSDVIFLTTYTIGGKTYRNIAYAVAQKEMHYTPSTIHHTVAPAEGGYNVTLSSDKFERAVFLKIKGIDNFFSDNYFDLLPGEKRIIHVKTNKDIATFSNELEIISLADAK
ncbi:MAG: beta-mannosidase [Prevotella sp.]